MSILLKEDFGNESTIPSYPQWFNLVQESLKRCMPSKRKQYMKLLEKAWEEKDSDSKIIFLFDILKQRCGVAFYDQFTLELKEIFPSLGEKIEKRPDVFWENKMLVLIAVPPNIVRAIAVPYQLI
jgi:hypothetical protein